MNKMEIALIYGGAGHEHDVSLLGKDNVMDLIKRAGYEPLEIYIDRQGSWHYIAAGASVLAYPIKQHGVGGFMTEVGFIPCDCAVPLLHGDLGEDGVIMGALECVGIPYIGSRVTEGALLADKGYTKAVAERLGISTAKWKYLRLPIDEAVISELEEEIGYPMFIKPARLGSSIGASGARCRAELIPALEKAFGVGGGRVLAEELIADKRELECAVYSVGDVLEISPPAEVLTDGTYTYKRKYEENTETELDPVIPEHISRELREYAGRLASFLEIRHLARIDFFLSGERLLFNEINTFPGFTRDSLYPRLLQAMGRDPSAAIADFIRDAVSARTL